MLQVTKQADSPPPSSLRRKSAEEIRKEFLAIAAQPVLTQVLDAVPMICMLLNDERQIVFANKATLEFMGLEDRFALSGFRPGEALECVHAIELQDGCGTGPYCTMCGAAQELGDQHDWERDGHECRILRNNGMEALDLRVSAVPAIIDDQPFVIFTMVDISHQKRRSVLERVFFHDILNTAGAIRGFSDLLCQKMKGPDRRQADLVRRLSTRLVEEIEGQRELRAAENNELKARPRAVNVFKLLEEIRQQHQDPPPPKGRRVQLASGIEGIVVKSDPVLLRRVLGNLVKNALEASQLEGVILLGADAKDGTVGLWVRNPEPMPPDVQLQVFQRSFSTKGTGRGLGTFGVKLITEKYLKGKVSFESSPEVGTIFRIGIPNDFAE
jgi:signal transduction histidine kinase